METIKWLRYLPVACVNMRYNRTES